jgi:hypothetical protein
MNPLSRDSLAAVLAALSVGACNRAEVKPEPPSTQASTVAEQGSKLTSAGEEVAKGGAGRAPVEAAAQASAPSISVKEVTQPSDGKKEAGKAKGCAPGKCGEAGCG